MITDPIEIELDVCKILETFVEKHSDGEDKTPQDVQLALIELAARAILGASAAMYVCDPANAENGRGRAGAYPMHTRRKISGGVSEGSRPAEPGRDANGGMEHFLLMSEVRDQLERGGMTNKDAVDYSWLVGQWALR